MRESVKPLVISGAICAPVRQHVAKFRQEGVRIDIGEQPAIEGGGGLRRDHIDLDASPDCRDRDGVAEARPERWAALGFGKRSFVGCRPGDPSGMHRLHVRAHDRDNPQFALPARNSFQGLHQVLSAVVAMGHRAMAGTAPDRKLHPQRHFLGRRDLEHLWPT
jgi:hypothetical protein